MPQINAYERVSVVSPEGKPLGRVAAVLFHPSEPCVVGVQVDPGAVLGLIGRRPRFVILGDLTRTDEGALRLAARSLPADSAGERRLGFSWEDSVIWRGMPVRSQGGDAVGVVHDVSFASDTGCVTLLMVSTGVVGDAALGKLEVSAELIAGFAGDSVLVLPGYNEIRAGGGAAKVVASGVATIKTRGGQVADGALQVGVAAAGALGRSLRKGTARKALDKIKSLMDEDE